MKKKKIIKKLIFTIIILLIIIKIVSMIIVTTIKNEEISVKELMSYNVNDLIETVMDKDEIVNIQNEKCVYDENYKFIIDIPYYSQEHTYKISYGIDDNNMKEFVIQKNQTEIAIKLKEGKNNLIISVQKNNKEIKNAIEEVYYIKPYKKQFLDEKSKNGTEVHYRDGTMEKFDKSYTLLKNSGNKVIRVEFLWQNIYQNGIYDFDKYDKYINEMNQDNFTILALVNGFGNLAGEDKKINTEDEIGKFVEFVEKIIEKYPFIKDYEILNEINMTSSYKGAYLNEEDSKWYVEILRKLSENKEKNFIVAGTAVPMQKNANQNETMITSQEFYINLFKNDLYKCITSFAFHPYCNNQNNNDYLYETMNLHKKLYSEIGGFEKQYATEYGFSVFNNEINKEEIQASKIIQQSTILDKYINGEKIQYNFWNTKENFTDKNDNFGLLNNDYTPKLSYYAMKNYCENTNGAEYIGTVNLADGLEAHVYNKDGKPKIITWSTNTGKNIDIDYKDFTAKDLYGKDIESSNEKLTVTTSPVYLGNISTNYFYKAISNTAIEKYKEFEERFDEQIAKVEGLSNKINEQKSYMENIEKLTYLNEGASIQAINEHYNLGNMVLQAYKDKKLDIEFVKLSSMLDALDDIGNSYEDLVTVSAKTRNANIIQTNQKIQEVENLLYTNQDSEIVYPRKILEFSKDYYDKANYINGLEEENDIKTGLIVSKNLHSYLLANWAKMFLDLYIDQYVVDNPVTIGYSETNLTNKDVKATLTTNASIDITNNEKNKEYTFTKNGSFVFNYTIRGRKFKIEANANNIDKTLPVITGIEEGRTYLTTSKVKPQITDENLKEVKLLLNGQIVNNYVSNSAIQEEGIYQLIAIDKAGNETCVRFQIRESKDEDYKIEDKQIKNIDGSTKKIDFKTKLKLNEEYSILRNNKEISDNDKIFTGDILKTKSGKEYTLIVTGDINKDGVVNIKDIIDLRKYILLGNNLDDIELMAADTNLDGKEINIKDLVRMRMLVLNNNK